MQLGSMVKTSEKDCSRSRNLQCGNSRTVTEPEYDVVDDQEQVLNVRILPARPIDGESQYADRDLPRSSSAQSLSSLCSGNSTSIPRDLPVNPRAGPAVNRNLKPSRRKVRLAKRLLPVQSGEQRSHRSSSPPPFAAELASRLSVLTVHGPCRTAGLRTSTQVELGQNEPGRLSAEHFSVLTNQRHSLDLDSQDLNQRSQQYPERPSKVYHHEWPQTKDDFDQHDFVPVEKPQQTYCEEDWYVGPCNRADAEHALHLMNKDGAFLVRDCSTNSNSEPLVLAVYHEKKVYNVKIRFIESSRKFALGTAQRPSDMFDTVADIIKFHSIFPVILISGRNMPGSRSPENCVLTCPVTKQDVDQLLQ